MKDDIKIQCDEEWDPTELLFTCGYLACLSDVSYKKDRKSIFKVLQSLTIAGEHEERERYINNMAKKRYIEFRNEYRDTETSRKENDS